jgi:uncharacterized protein (DUF2147 family)
MKRISVALLLTLLSSTAHASGYSFSFGGHRIHVEASRHCRSLSCVSWSEGGLRRSHRDDDEEATSAPAKPVVAAPACVPVATPAAPAAPETAAPPSTPAPVAPAVPAPAPIRVQAAPAPVAPAPVVQPAPVQPPLKPTRVVQAPAPSTIELAAANTQPVVKADIGKPKEKATVEATVLDRPMDTPDWAKDWSPPPKDTTAAAKTAEKPAKVVEHDDDSPVGDWQTEGKKGLVRIEKCGAALCGYLLNETTNAAGETVLSNMKAKTDAQWAGDIYSRASGNTYYAKMTFRQSDTLRVEACAIGRFFCSGNDWTRVPRSDAVATSRDLPASPKS